MKDQRDSKLNILIDISLDNLTTLAKKYVTDDNGRVYPLTTLEILQHVHTECLQLIQKHQVGTKSHVN